MHIGARVKRLEQVIVEVVKLTPLPVQEVIRGLQALRGVAHISAVTFAAELGNITSRFESARKLMGYSGAIPREDPRGKRKRQRSVTNQERQRTPTKNRRRIGLELSTLAKRRGQVE